MRVITGSPFLGRMLRSLAANLRTEVLEALVKLEASKMDEDRYHALADRNAEGTLGKGERQELEGIVSANTLLALLRKEAREVLHRRA